MHDTPTLLSAYDAEPVTEPIVPSGFAELDALTGGMQGGRVWVVVGTPGQGRTTLLVQLGSRLAAEGKHLVHLVTPRDLRSQVSSRLLSLNGLIPLDHLVAHSSSDLRLQEARDRVSRLSIRTSSREDEPYIPEEQPFEPDAVAIVIDDADRVSGVTEALTASYAEAGRFVLLSLPRHLVLRGPAEEADIDPQWASAADVIIEVRHRGLPEGTLRPGEAELTIHYNRWGHARNLPIQFQAHYSRFVEGPQ